MQGHVKPSEVDLNKKQQAAVDSAMKSLAGIIIFLMPEDSPVSLLAMHNLVQVGLPNVVTKGGVDGVFKLIFGKYQDRVHELFCLCKLISSFVYNSISDKAISESFNMKIEGLD